MAQSWQNWVLQKYSKSWFHFTFLMFLSALPLIHSTTSSICSHLSASLETTRLAWSPPETCLAPEIMSYSNVLPWCISMICVPDPQVLVCRSLQVRVRLLSAPEASGHHQEQKEARRWWCHRATHPGAFPNPHLLQQGPLSTKQKTGHDNGSDVPPTT